ncbi:MAG: glycosyltransferase family 4 protein [Verrucomicrobia bacterium]|nr:glycosyltransferase family 4 protein [Verrucomicrobiota bacterium]
MNMLSRKWVLVSSFRCLANGKSEGYSGYKWLEMISKFHDVTLLTADETSVPDGVRLFRPSELFSFKNKLLRRMNGEISFDYYRFDWASGKKMALCIGEYDLVHQVVPMAPRYSSSVGVLGKKFILGPIGGGQRVPPIFRKEVEGNEEWFLKLRLLDRLRLEYDPFLRKTYHAADMILLVGRFMLGLIPEEFHGKCRFMLETGIDAASYRPFERPDGNDGNVLNLLYVGRVVPYKGLIYALRALAGLLADEKRAVRFWVIGDRGESAYLTACKKLVITSGLASVVEFLGFKNKEEIVNYYQRADLFVFPSLAEAGGNVLLEAMACGCPALIANCGGPSEIVTEDSGYLIEPKDPEYLIDEMTRVIRSLIGHRDRLAGMRREARKVIEQKFDWSRKGLVMEEWYREVIEGPKYGNAGDVTCRVGK